MRRIGRRQAMVVLRKSSPARGGELAQPVEGAASLTLCSLFNPCATLLCVAALLSVPGRIDR